MYRVELSRCFVDYCMLFSARQVVMFQLISYCPKAFETRSPLKLCLVKAPSMTWTMAHIYSADRCTPS